MKSSFPHIGLAKLCGWFGITRQAYYQNSWRAIDTSIEEEFVLAEVCRIREDHKRLGARKLYDKLQVFLLDHQIKMGRDALFTLLSANNMLVRRRKRYIQTTQSSHWLRKYPNLIKDFVPTAPNQLWVSDITYWKIQDTHVYISFITDAFSRKIVGYHVASTMEAIETVKALKMALKGLKNEKEDEEELIHHSDRGLQYCSNEYVKLLKRNEIGISMTENGDPLENAIAERVNGIIKEEYLQDYTARNMAEAREILDYAIDLYNNDRPHNSLGNLVPSFVHSTKIKTERLWKNYYKKRTTIVNQLQD